MSNLDNAIQSINAAADRTTKTTEFVDQLSTYDDISDVTNPNTGATVPSLQKKTRLVAEAAFAESETQINQAVSDAEAAALAAQSAANYETEFIAGVTAAVKGRSYLYDGSMWACLNDTTETPEIGNTNWYSLANHKSLTNRDEPGAHPASAIATSSSGTLQEYIDNETIRSWRSVGDIRGWGASPEKSPSENRECIQQALDESMCTYVPDVGSPFLVDGPIRPNSYQLIDGFGEIKNITVYGQGPETNYLDSFVMLNKVNNNDVFITINNWSDLNTRYPIGNYKAGDYIRISCANAEVFNVGEFVIIESTQFYSSGFFGLPKDSFVSKVSEVGGNYISLESPHRLDIGDATIRSLNGYVMAEAVTVRNVTLTGSYYVGDGQFGGFGGIIGYNNLFDNVKINAGIGYSVNFLHRTRIANCVINAEYVGIEEALLSSDNDFINNKIYQRAGFVSAAFGKNGNKSSSGIMSAEGASGSIHTGNEILGDWYIGAFYKLGALPFETSNNYASGAMYAGYYYTDPDVNCKFNNNVAKMRGTHTYGVFAEPGVKLVGNGNMMDVGSIGYIINRAYLTGDRNDSTANVKTRLTLNDSLAELPSEYIKTQDKLVDDVYYTSGETVEINTLPEGVLFEQHVSANSVCEKGVGYEMEAHFNFTTSAERGVKINIGSTSASFNVSGMVVHIKANIINSMDDGSTGYGLGAIKLTCDGVSQQKALSVYPNRVWDGSPIKVAVTGFAGVSARFFKSTFANNFCKLLL